MADLRLIAFRLGPETFLFDIMAVRQIVPYAGSTSVPTAPSFVEGVIVIRDEVIPVIDLRDRLFPALEDRAEQHYLLICHAAGGVIGLKVDQVRRILTVSSEALLPPPPLVRGIRGELLVAIVRMEDEVFLLLDLDQVLTAAEQRALQSTDLSPADAAAGTGEG